MKKTLFATALVLLAAAAIFGQAPPPEKGEKKWFVLFSAREASLRPFSLAGHAFVSWGTSRPGSDTIALPLTLGFYPAEKTDLGEEVVGNRKGRLVGGWFKNGLNRRSLISLVIRTDSATWAHALDTAYTWSARGYNLLDRNCVRFMDEVAMAAQLRTPRVRMMLGFPRRPTNYLRRLAKKNREEVVSKTTHTFQKTPKEELFLPKNIDLERVRRAEKLSKNGKAVD